MELIKIVDGLCNNDNMKEILICAHDLSMVL